ncbi:hypothetical protein Hanom_Chr01g00039521 [Helianthus anomalus]
MLTNRLVVRHQPICPPILHHLCQYSTFSFPPQDNNIFQRSASMIKSLSFYYFPRMEDSCK